MLHEQISTLNSLSFKLLRFKWTTANKVANCRCDVCGDSEKNSYKTRMYFYVKDNDLMVKCQNCGYSKGFVHYLREFHINEFQSYKLAVLSYKRKVEDFKPKPKALDYKPDNSALEALAASRDFGLTLDKLPVDHPAVVYYDGRGLPDEKKKLAYYTDNYKDWVEKNFGKLESKIPNDQRIVFILKDTKDTIHYVQGRAIDPEATLRYVSLSVNKDSDYPKIWGVETLNIHAPTLAFEGILDALFFDNSVAVCGGDFASIKPYLPDNTIVVCDNEPRHKDTVSRMNKAIDAGFSVAFLPHSIQEKDINLMVQSGLDVDYIYDCIVNSALSGGRAKARMMMWKKI